MAGLLNSLAGIQGNDNVALSGIGAGLSSFADAFRQSRMDNASLAQQALENQQKKKMYDLDLEKAGLSESTDAGGKSIFGMAPSYVEKQKALKDIETQQENKKQDAEFTRQARLAGNDPIFDDKGNFTGFQPIQGFSKPDQGLKGIQLQLEALRLASEQNKNTPAGRLQGLPADKGLKVGMLAHGLEDLTDYENAFREGGRRKAINSSTPLVGGLISTTPIDEVTNRLSDTLGRLRSGGAINAQEEARFAGLLPRPGDNDEDAARKLLSFRREFETSLTGEGFTPDQLASTGQFNLDKMGYGKGVTPDRGLLNKAGPAAIAGGNDWSAEKEQRLQELQRKAATKVGQR